MSAQHTPGPWVHYDLANAPSQKHEIAAYGKTVAHVYCTKGDEAQDAANARLIAAAPDLLKACENLLWAIEEPAEGAVGMARELRNFEGARVAIAKAKGTEA